MFLLVRPCPNLTKQHFYNFKNESHRENRGGVKHGKHQICEKKEFWSTEQKLIEIKRLSLA